MAQATAGRHYPGAASRRHGTQERVVSLEVFRECVLGVREMIDLKSRGLLLAIRSDFRAARKILNELAIATESAAWSKSNYPLLRSRKRRERSQPRKRPGRHAGGGDVFDGTRAAFRRI